MNFIKEQNLNEVKKIIINSAKKCVHISNKETKAPFKNSIELCQNKSKSCVTRNVQCLIINVH